MSQKKCIVTGAAGFMGSHLVDHLLAEGYEVTGVDNFSWSSPEQLEHHKANPSFELVEMDIRASEKMQNLFQQIRPESVYHLAALHFIPAAEDNHPEALSINVVGTASVLDAFNASGGQRFWFASTGDVYRPTEESLHEDMPIEPFNIYGHSKLMGEKLVGLHAGREREKHYVVGRLFNLYGSRETNPHIIPEILGQLKKDPHGTLHLGNLWPRRDLVPVGEAARAAHAMLAASTPGVLTANVATGVAQSMQELIDMIAEIRGAPIAIEKDPSKVRSVERPHLQADVERLKNLIGWTPNHDLRTNLTSLLDSEGFILKRSA